MPTALIVDDSKVDQRLAGRLLETRSDYSVRYADDGEAALASIDQHPPDVVITDLQMPGLSGLDLVRAVRQRYPGVPVVLMTAMGSEGVAAEALRHGASSYVPKKLLSRDLAVTVERILTVTDVKHEHDAVVACYQRMQSTFELGNEADAANPLVQHLRRDLSRLNWCDQTELMRIGVALDEAISNAINHGNLEGDSTVRETSQQNYLDTLAARRTQPPYRDRRVTLDATITPAAVTYIITDEGPGFDPATLPDPTDPANLERVCGRGLLLIRTFMDEVSHNETGNQITMVKRRETGAGELE